MDPALRHDGSAMTWLPEKSTVIAPTRAMVVEAGLKSPGACDFQTRAFHVGPGHLCMHYIYIYQPLTWTLVALGHAYDIVCMQATMRLITLTDLTIDLQEI